MKTFLFIFMILDLVVLLGFLVYLSFINIDEDKQHLDAYEKAMVKFFEEKERS